MNCRKQEALSNPKKRRLLKRRRVSFSTDIVDDVADCSRETESSTTTCLEQQHIPVPSDTWYSPEALDELKNNIKEQAKRYRLLSNKAVSSAATESSLVLPFRNCGLYKKMKYIVWVQKRISSKDPLSNNNDSTGKTPPGKSSHECQFRGLEHRIFFERQRNKTIAMNTVLEFQKNCDLAIKEAEINQLSALEIQKMKDQHAQRLSTIYAQLSQWAKDEAIAAAHYDACGVYTIPSNSCSNEVANAMAELAKKRKVKAIVSDDDDVSITSWISSSSCVEGPQTYKRPRIT